MSVIQLPLRTDLTHYDFGITLDGVAYNFELRWNTRDEAWFLDLRLESGEAVYTGIRVVINWPLALRCRHESHPPGQLLAVDTSGKDAEPGIDDFGSRVLLLYYDAAQITELRAELDG